MSANMNDDGIIVPPEDAPRKRLGRHLGMALCEAFGLDPSTVTRLVLTCDVSDVATLDVAMFPKVTDAGIKVLDAEIKRYEIKGIES